MDISIIIAAYRRRETLLRALSLYAGQREVGGSFEAVVVDDASTDGTVAAVEDFARTSPYPVRIESLARNSGPSAARNRALEVARGRILIFVGDDILPEAGFLAAHRRWHTEIHPDPAEAMVGRIVWADEMQPTPLLRWLENDRSQFAFGDMAAGTVLDYGRFYTSNASVKRAFLDSVGARFDERLRFHEDSEFALRLSRAGMILRHDPSARAQHFHPTDLASSLRRAEAIGASLPALRGISPENFRRTTNRLFEEERRARRLALCLLTMRPLPALVWTPLARVCERRLYARRIFGLAHAAAMLRGLRQSAPETDGGLMERHRAALREARSQAPEVPGPVLLGRALWWRACKLLHLKPTVRVHGASRMRLQAVRGDHGIRTGIYLLRDRYEPSVREAIDRTLRPGDSAIDIGSNLGLWALRMAERVGRGGRVFAFEPMPETLQALRENLRLSGAAQVDAHGIALGAREGSATLHVPIDLGSASMAPPDGAARQVSVPVRRLDDVWRDLGRPRIRLVKIDVEGAEPAVLRGGRGFFDVVRPVVCCEINTPRLAALGYGVDALTSFFTGMGYRMLEWSAEACRFVQPVSLPEGGVLDVIFIRPEHSLSSDQNVHERTLPADPAPAHIAASELALAGSQST